MSFGSVQYVVECQPTAGASVAPCADIAGVTYAPVVVSAYVLDPSSQAAIEAALDPVDPSIFGAWFAFIFVTTVSFYFTARGIGFVIDLLRGRS